jgi:hypothetical protein
VVDQLECLAIKLGQWPNNKYPVSGSMFRQFGPMRTCHEPWAMSPRLKFLPCPWPINLQFPITEKQLFPLIINSLLTFSPLSCVFIFEYSYGCKLLVWAPSEQVVIDVPFDVKFCADLIPKLKTFYFTHMLPRIVDDFQSGRLTLCSKYVHLCGVLYFSVFKWFIYFVSCKALSALPYYLSITLDWCFCLSQFTFICTFTWFYICIILVFLYLALYSSLHTCLSNAYG